MSEIVAFVNKQNLSLDLKEAQRVLTEEADALLKLSASLDGTFLEIINLIHSISGRVVVTGMGKSGLIARKIAATLASTGTPATFVHPAEASHGDLGMIAEGDVVLALSNSGETEELSSILHYSKRFAIPVVAITQGAESTLARSADFVLLLPRLKEACPIQLAPTTSTTMMVALGDALALSLLQKKGFSQNDFGILHPGGQLGRKLLYVSAIMRPFDRLPRASLSTLMQDVILIMTAGSLGCVAIIDSDNTLAGIITDGDLRRHMQENFLALEAREVMTTNPKTIGPKTLVAEAIHIMNQQKITHLFVMADDESPLDKHHPLGLIQLHDCLRAQ